MAPFLSESNSVQYEELPDDNTVPDGNAVWQLMVCMLRRCVAAGAQWPLTMMGRFWPGAGTPGQLSGTGTGDAHQFFCCRSLLLARSYYTGGLSPEC